MFKHIFNFEFNQWFNKPLFYIYVIILAGIGGLSMAATGGVFDGSTATVSSISMINSPLQICMSIGAYCYMAYLLLPSIIGATLQKDFNSNMFKVMYSYPFGKRDYIFGKFFSSFLIAAILFFFVGLGTYVGTLIEGVDKSVVLPFDFGAYARTYAVWILPNLFLFSAIVFSVTLYTRSIIAGFIALVAIFFIQGMTDVFLMDTDYDKLGALLDPFGLGAVNYTTKYWTIVEQNDNAVPITDLVLYNRLIWSGISLAIFGATYRWFTFSYTPRTFSLWKSKEETKSVSTKPGGIIDVNLPDVSYTYGVKHALSSAWALTKIDLKYIIKGGPFIVVSLIGILFIIILAAFTGQFLQTTTLPVTRSLLLVPGTFFSLLIALLTFIYVGLLIHRPQTVGIFQLEDASSAPTWSVVLSRVMSIVLMQVALLGIIMVTGIAIQIYNGFYNFELDLYLFELYGVRLINYLNWGLLALLVYTLVPNFYLGLAILMVLGIGLNFISQLGIEQDIFKFNDGSTARYSDISGYGRSLPAYYMYKVYWLFLGLFFYFLSVLLWNRGVSTSLWHRIKNIKKRTNKWNTMGLVGSFIGFLTMGGMIWYQTNIADDYMPSKERELLTVNYEKNYKHYGDLPQPKIIDVSINVDLYPETQDLKASGRYILLNKSQSLIDTVFIETTDLVYELELNRTNDIALHDTVNNVRIIHLQQALQPGEQIELSFKLENKKNTTLRSNSPVRSNGTFFNNYQFPVIGYMEMAELTDKKTRKKHGLAEKDVMASPEDSVARMSNYISANSDWIDFEATVSTAPDQIAMAPGKLQKEWEENGRKYYQYKMGSKMLHFYNIISGRYELYEDKWRDIPITIYYHKSHDYNLERMMKGAKASLEYCSNNFSPYQHDQLRILEFPIVIGNFAQSFANTVPFSEGIGFIADVDDSDKGGVDFPFAVSAHEVAHQWWAHQVIGANTKGSTMMAESLSEYVSLMVLQHTYGKKKMRTFLKDALDKYLMGRTVDRQKEQPLMFVENQPHIHYQKGSMIFYAIADYIGEEKLNGVLSAYVDSVAFQEPPYTISAELVGMIRAVTPDSMQYLIEDMFENITLYDNRIIESSYTKREDGKYDVTFNTQTTKYRTGDKGKRSYKNTEGDSLVADIEGFKKPVQSLPLADYIDIGIFGQDEEGEETILYLNRHKIEAIEGTYTLVVDEEPREVGIDPYNKLIDTNSEDNRKKISEK